METRLVVYSYSCLCAGLPVAASPLKVLLVRRAEVVCRNANVTRKPPADGATQLLRLRINLPEFPIEQDTDLKFYPYSCILCMKILQLILL